MLCNDLLIEILNYLSFKERKKCSLVCKSWFYLIRESTTFSGKIKLNFGRYNSPPESFDLINFIAKSWPQLHTLYVGEYNESVLENADFKVIIFIALYILNDPP